MAPLGKGGMGEVYLARDTTLDRKVALKLLPAEFTDHKDCCVALFRRRRQRPHSIIQTSSRFMKSGRRKAFTSSQPSSSTAKRSSNACSGDANANCRRFLTSQFKLASALQAAHAAALVHRDIKPENIMVRSGRLCEGSRFRVGEADQKSRTNQSVAGSQNDTMVREQHQTRNCAGNS